jgi:chaperone required for assembly of F1-ATPase
MSEWKAKRFWKQASAEAVDGGFGIFLDGRPVKTPAKAALVVPTLALAQAIAAEWDAQEDQIDPNVMPLTRAANAAIDKVTIQFSEVADMLAEYGGTDLLCYRADGPAELIERQAAAWDPLLDWAGEALNARLIPVEGVMFAAQPHAALPELHRQVHELDVFALTAFHDFVGITGSLILGFAMLHQKCDAEQAWTLSRIDETWQIEQWGADEEAEELATTKSAALADAQRFYQLSLT